MAATYKSISSYCVVAVFNVSQGLVSQSDIDDFMWDELKRLILDAHKEGKRRITYVGMCFFLKVVHNLLHARLGKTNL